MDVFLSCNRTLFVARAGALQEIVCIDGRVFFFQDCPASTFRMISRFALISKFFDHDVSTSVYRERFYRRP